MRINGCIEFASTAGYIGGWARCEDPEIVVDLALVAGGVVIQESRPDRYRAEFDGTFGYWIETAASIDLVDLISGRLQLRASVPGMETPMILGALEQVRDQAVEEFVLKNLSILQEDDLARFSRALGNEVSDRASRQGDGHVANRRNRDNLSQTLSRLQSADLPSDIARTSTIQVPLGHLSLDGTALIGQDGCLFLVGGSNSVLHQYLAEPDDSTLASHALGWIDRFSSRRALCETMGTGYLQIIVPEKLGIARELFPRMIAPVSPLLSKIEAIVARTPELSDHYVSGRSVLDSAGIAARHRSVRKTDSHLSGEGIVLILQAMLQKMGVPLPELPSLSKSVTMSGDLAERFFGMPLFEQGMLPDDAFCDALSDGLELIEAYNPPGGHIGIRYIWKNPKAKIPMKVIAFGNSYFERGGDAGCLSWWFARMFSEFHFLWDPSVDPAYIAAEKPDWVICQTIERFLPSVAER